MTRPITAHLGKRAFTPDQITGPSAAIYTTLADGQWHDRAEIITATAAAVPAAIGYRTSVRPGDPTPTGTAYTAAVIRGQRAFASNRLLIQVRGRHVIQDPDNPKRYRLADGIADAWNTHREGQ